MAVPFALALAQVSSADTGQSVPSAQLLEWPNTPALPCPPCREEAKIEARSETCSLGKAFFFFFKLLFPFPVK